MTSQITFQTMLSIACPQYPNPHLKIILLSIIIYTTLLIHWRPFTSPLLICSSSQGRIRILSTGMIARCWTRKDNIGYISFAVFSLQSVVSDLKICKLTLFYLVQKMFVAGGCRTYCFTATDIPGTLFLEHEKQSKVHLEDSIVSSSIQFMFSTNQPFSTGTVNQCMKRWQLIPHRGTRNTFNVTCAAHLARPDRQDLKRGIYSLIFHSHNSWVTNIACFDFFLSWCCLRVNYTDIKHKPF